MAVTKPTGFSSVPKGIYKVNADIAEIPTISTLDVGFTVPCDTGDFGFLIPASTFATGALWGTGWCATAGTMTFRFVNPTAGGINPSSADYYVVVM